MATILDNKTPLGKIILKNLYLKGKNQAWLAEEIGVNPNHISILCSKIKNPKVETLKKLSKALDIELEDLYKAVAETVEITEK
jgi:transcriptional regulator with XRE-family HTH domain